MHERLKEHDPSIEPIVVLGCGHAYTLSTLDGLMDLASAYVKVRLRFPWLSLRASAFFIVANLQHYAFGVY